jgi:hypothetical protein
MASIQVWDRVNKAHGWPKCGAGLGPYHLVPGSGRHDLGTGALGLYPTQTKQGNVKQRLP